MEEKAKPYMNPYLAGILMGLLLLLTVFITGRGLGASGAIKGVVVKTVNTIAPTHAENSVFYKNYTQSNNGNPLRNWLVFEVIGVIIGAFVSGLISNRNGFKLEKGPKVTNRTRIAGAILGGLLFGLGSQFGRGCTSGAALSGMAVMSLGGIITMFSIFGSAYAFAFFFRKLWIKK